MNRVQAAIALGSNLGNSLEIVEAALEVLDEIQDIQVMARSSWYRTTPVGPPQPDYINGCALLTVESTPPEILLQTLLAIEQKFGRVRRERWGPRVLDLDILLFGGLTLNSSGLEIPHPRMRERAFVLVPLAEIAPDWIDPITEKTIVELAKMIDCSGIWKIF
ncbi:MAG: 2-amino-4-hydroxy-6-hydroxymethyldihydropteridine diphosphokinase [Microcoleaceae cyanobacterium]